jgi:hypothetical protein
MVLHVVKPINKACCNLIKLIFMRTVIDHVDVSQIGCMIVLV